MIYSITIVGLGIAGILTLAHIPTERLSEVLVIEGSCIGGDLSSLYSGIFANITKAVIVTAFQKVPRWSTATFPFLDAYQDTDCPKLGDVCRQMVSLIRGDLDRVECRTATATSITDNGDDWSIQTSAGTFRSKKVILCIGGVPKVLDIPRPAIPLHVALSKDQLVNNVTAEDNVVVFGTSHSGTLVMRNLKEAGVRNITGVYRGKTPFLFARDGHSEGIKQESATVADEILAAAWGEQTPTLMNYDDFGAIFRRTSLATRVIYAHGFQRRSIQCIDRENNTITLKHNPADGSFEGYVGRLWGFGLAYPSTYVSNGATYSDIGFAGFITAIAVALPAI
jgi:glycine/D-amino acid oxidase-like deaminating enzyme